MAIYDFSLLCGYEFSGVDVAQGVRARALEKYDSVIQYIYIDMPQKRDTDMYISQGILRKQMIESHLFMSGIKNMEFSISLNSFIEENLDEFEYDNTKWCGENLSFFYQNEKIVQVVCDKNKNVINVDYLKKNHIYMKNYYFDRLAYSEIYDNNGNIEKTIYFDSVGKIIFDNILVNGKSIYTFANGKRIDYLGFIEEFIKSLRLTDKDICIMDRTGSMPYTRALFENHNGAKLIGVLHSCHYFEPFENAGSVTFNYEYYYWFKYSREIDTFVVGTLSQKTDLIKKLKEHDVFVPNIAVIPPGYTETDDLNCVDEFQRKRNSIISVSRLTKQKGVDILVKSVIKAHEFNHDITLDLYGDGDKEFINELKTMIYENRAGNYIHFMGHQDVKNVYKTYELYVGLSFCESFGLSMLEALSAGNAFVGFNTKYGNREFIKNGYNGYVMEFNITKDIHNLGSVIDNVAQKIVDIFNDTDQLKKFQINSYRMARQYSKSEFQRKWVEILKVR